LYSFFLVFGYERFGGHSGSARYQACVAK